MARIPMAGTSLAVIALAMVDVSLVLVLDDKTIAPSRMEAATTPEVKAMQSGGQSLAKPNTGATGTEAQ